MLHSNRNYSAESRNYVYSNECLVTRKQTQGYIGIFCFKVPVIDSQAING